MGRKEFRQFEEIEIREGISLNVEIVGGFVVDRRSIPVQHPRVEIPRGPTSARHV